MSSLSSNGPAASSPIFVGIDVAKENLDLARSDADRTERFTNDSDGIAHLVATLVKAQPAAIVVESTGGLERPLLSALLEADLPTALVHPGRVRYFARGLGILAKTDPIDAAVLARFAQLASPRLSQKRSEKQVELRDLLACRRQLVATRTQQSNRRGTTFSAAAKRSIDAVLKVLDRQIDSLDKQIRELIDADDDFKHLDQLLRSVPGVGPGLAAAFAADLRELGTTDRQRICALVGVAPFANDSGGKTGKRSIRGGRTALRSMLYMATLAALRVNPVIRAFVDRLSAAGKAKKVVIVAAMRKLLSLLHVMVRDNLTWDQLNVVKPIA